MINFLNISHNDNPDKGARTDFILVSSSSPVCENMRTPEEAAKDKVGYESSIRSIETSAEKGKENQNEQS